MTEDCLSEMAYSESTWEPDLNDISSSLTDTPTVRILYTFFHLYCSHFALCYCLIMCVHIYAAHFLSHFSNWEFHANFYMTQFHFRFPSPLDGRDFLLEGSSVVFSGRRKC
jgi:hypothetical protein